MIGRLRRDRSIDPPPDSLHHPCWSGGSACARRSGRGW